MKKTRLSLFFLFAVSFGCTLEDTTPLYAGRYNFTYKYTDTKNGIATSSDTMVGFMEVDEGSAKGTVTLNNAKDSKGNVIDFNVKTGNYEYAENFEMEGCQCELTIEGRFDSANYMTYKQRLIVTCEKDKRTAVLEGKAER